MTLKVLTANRLIDGEVVYLTPNRDWSEWLSDAAPLAGEAEHIRVQNIGEEAVADRVVVAPYLVPVEDVAGELRPLSQREWIRAKGPSVHPAFGKQAVGA